MNVSDMQGLLGKNAVIILSGMKVNVTILDVRNSYGNIHVYITPHSGEGSTWVDMSRIRLM